MPSNFRFIKYGDPIRATQLGVEKGNIALGIFIVGQAKNNAPFKDGFLRNSIQYKTLRQGSRGGFPGLKEVVKKPNELIVGASADYAVYQELGTRRMKAQPYLRPAIEMSRRRIQPLLRGVFDTEMKRETK